MRWPYSSLTNLKSLTSRNATVVDAPDQRASSLHLGEQLKNRSAIQHTGQRVGGGALRKLACLLPAVGDVLDRDEHAGVAVAERPHPGMAATLGSVGVKDGPLDIGIEALKRSIEGSIQLAPIVGRDLLEELQR